MSDDEEKKRFIEYSTADEYAAAILAGLLNFIGTLSSDEIDKFLGSFLRKELSNDLNILISKDNFVYGRFKYVGDKLSLQSDNHVGAPTP
jgi:hypothetical protein